MPSFDTYSTWRVASAGMVTAPGGRAHAVTPPSRPSKRYTVAGEVKSV
ncbi:hypothetical protein ACFQ1L_01325 [Phytohabitans flavus]